MIIKMGALLIIAIEIIMLALVVMDTKAIVDGDIKINHIGILFKLLIYGSVLVEMLIIVISIINFRANNLDMIFYIELFVISIITFIIRMIASTQKIDSMN